MNFELKHLAPYLPYSVHLMNTYNRWHNTTSNECLNISTMLDMKLILRPISDLDYKSAKELREEFKVNDDITYWLQELTIDKLRVKNITVETYDFLLSKHFDVFNLIENGLAISIHAVEQADA